MVRIYEEACAAAVSAGCANLAALYASGKGVKVDLARARELYAKGCNDGDMNACMGLGDLYRRGPPGEHARSIPLYERACKANIGRACTQAGHMYRQVGRTNDAHDWYERGCPLGDDS